MNGNGYQEVCPTVAAAPNEGALLPGYGKAKAVKESPDRVRFLPPPSPGGLNSGEGRTGQQRCRARFAKGAAIDPARHLNSWELKCRQKYALL